MLKTDSGDMGIGQDSQVASLARGTQIGDRRADAAAVARSDVVITCTFLTGRIEVRITRDANTLCGLDKRIAERVPVRQFRHRKRPVPAMKVIGAALKRLGLAKVRQHIIESPSRIAQSRPFVEILALPAYVDQAIDRTGTAEHLAARGEHTPASQLGFRLGLIHPVHLRFGEQLAVTDRHMDPRISIGWAGLEQQNGMAPVFTEPVGKNATGRSGPNDDVVVFHGTPVARPKQTVETSLVNETEHRV